LQREINSSKKIPESKRIYYPDAIHINEITGEKEGSKNYGVNEVVYASKYDPKLKY
jgi:hypothetical protein